MKLKLLVQYINIVKKLWSRYLYYNSLTNHMCQIRHFNSTHSKKRSCKTTNSVACQANTKNPE